MHASETTRRLVASSHHRTRCQAEACVGSTLRFAVPVREGSSPAMRAASVMARRVLQLHLPTHDRESCSAERGVLCGAGLQVGLMGRQVPVARSTMILKRPTAGAGALGHRPPTAIRQVTEFGWPCWKGAGSRFFKRSKKVGLGKKHPVCKT